MAKREFDREGATLSEDAPKSFDAVWDEAREHVFPWGRKFVTRSRGVQALTLAFSLAVTVAWVLGILGHLRPKVVIGWWLAWSVFEVLVRVRCQPWIRQGPVLRRMRRAASAREIVFYVSAKNILIGALLLLLVGAIGR